MIRLIMLILATLSVGLFLFAVIKGRDKTDMVQGLDGSEYFLKDLYVVGLALNDTKLFRLRGGLERSLKKNTKILVDNIYYEYYTYVTWAQFLSLSLLTLSAGLTLCALAPDQMALLLFAVTVILVAAIWNASMSKAKDAVQKRREDCELEFPNMVSKLCLLLTSGMVLREAWYLVAGGKDGPLYELMKRACQLMDNGESEVSAIYKFGVLSDSMEIKKFSSALIQNAEKGNSELESYLSSQVAELWAHKRQLALQRGEIAAGKLIVPLGLMFAGVIIIIVAAAMQSMAF